jgi:hypothetical protein
MCCTNHELCHTLMNGLKVKRAYSPKCCCFGELVVSRLDDLKASMGVVSAWQAVLRMADELHTGLSAGGVAVPDLTVVGDGAAVVGALQLHWYGTLPSLSTNTP